MDESLSWNEPVGAAIVLAGIPLAQGRILRPRRQPAVLPVSPGLGVTDGP